MLLEDIAELVLWLVVAVVAINLVFLGSVVYRRVTRGLYYRRKDEARARFGPVVERFIRYELTQGDAAEILRQARPGAPQDVVRELLLAQVRPDTADRVTALFFALGAVERWAKVAYGRRAGGVVVSALAVGHLPFPARIPNRLLDALERTRLLYVPRLLAVDSLGRLAPDYAEVFALAAMEDPSGEVRRVALTSLGRNRRALGIAHIFQELRAALSARAEISARSAKSALVCYGMEHLRAFVPFLSDPDPTFRFYVVDIVREISGRESRSRQLTGRDFPPQMHEEFLERLVQDESADVRARSAPVVRHFHEARASRALCRLLEDENEFVRLHAVRAAADAAYPELLSALVERMTDRRWRVREASVRALARLGEEAQQRLFREFAASQDRYESEQMTEEIERSGLARHLLADLGGGGKAAEVALAVCRRMAALGKTAMLSDELRHNEDPVIRKKLQEIVSPVASVAAGVA